MKVLVIALDTQIRSALEAQFDLRSRAFKSVGLEWLQPVVVDTQSALLQIPEDIGVVVNTLFPQDTLPATLALLAQACERAAVPLIQLSSCQVFDGLEGGRYRETDKLGSATALAQQLTHMEAVVQADCSRHILLRVGPLFSTAGKDLLVDLLNAFKRGETQRLSSRGKSCPLHAEDLARVISAIIDQLDCGCESWGIYHYCSSDPVSSYQFAETVLAAASQYRVTDQELLVLDADGGMDADWPKPLLNCEKIRNTFGIMQLPWRAFIAPTVKSIIQNNSIEEAKNEQQ